MMLLGFISEKSSFKQLFYILAVFVLLASCTFIAPLTVEKKSRSGFKDTSSERKAHQYFWNQLHQGNYDSISVVLDKLHNAYRKDPADFKLAAHLGFTYAWKITERNRLESVRPSIVSNGDLAQRYFEEAVALNGEDPRLKGFEAGFILANGDLHGDKRLQAEGYFKGKKAIRMWPSFNLFSIGYVMSTLPYESDKYKEALSFQWENLEKCLKRSVDRSNPTIDDINHMDDRVKGDKLRGRACVNSWIAPHNVEGFLLNLGDMLVKAGDTVAAKEVYNSVRQVEEFQEWPYKEMVGQRLKNIEDNTLYFRRENPVEKLKDRQVFINTSFSCTGCHQKSDTEFKVQNDSIPLKKSTYFLK